MLIKSRVRIAEQNFVRFKAKKRRKAGAFQAFLTRKRAKFAGKTLARDLISAYSGGTGQFQDGMKVKSNFAYTVTNGKLADTSLTRKLETAAGEAGLSVSEKDGILSTIAEMSTGIGNGTLKVEFLREAGSHKVALKYVVTSDAVPVSGGGTVTISAGLKYTFYLQDQYMPPANPELTPEAIDIMVDGFETKIERTAEALIGALGVLALTLAGIALTMGGALLLEALVPAFATFLKYMEQIAERWAVPV